LAESQQALYRLNRVINNLLDMTRIEAGALLPKLDWCDLGDLVQAAIDLAVDGVANHTIARKLDNELPLVRMDQRLLEPCLANLLLNAAASALRAARSRSPRASPAAVCSFPYVTRGKEYRRQTCRAFFAPFSAAAERAKAAPG
jgi:K+-sensing histidine kinase KdpD